MFNLRPLLFFVIPFLLDADPSSLTHPDSSSPPGQSQKPSHTRDTWRQRPDEEAQEKEPEMKFA